MRRWELWKLRRTITLEEVADYCKEHGIDIDRFPPGAPLGAFMAHVRGQMAREQLEGTQPNFYPRRRGEIK